MENIDIPYGHRLMITLGYLEKTISLISYPIGLILLSNGELEGGFIYTFSALAISPLYVFFGFKILNQLRRKEIEGLENLNTLIQIIFIHYFLLIVEAIFTDNIEFLISYLFTLPLTIFVYVYWRAPSHKKYFGSFEK